MTDVVHRNPDGLTDVPIASSTIGGKEVLHRKIVAMPGTMETESTEIKTAVAALAALITAGKLPVVDSTLAGYVDGVEAILTALGGYVDGVEALLTTVDGRVDGIEGKLDTLHTDLGTIDGRVDGLETLITSTNTKLDTIATNQGVPSGGPKFGQNDNIDTGADRQFSSQALSRGFVIKNISAGGQLLYISHASTPTASNSLVLAPGEWSPFIECTNANVPLMRPSANDAAACYVGA